MKEIIAKELLLLAKELVALKDEPMTALTDTERKKLEKNSKALGKIAKEFFDANKDTIVKLNELKKQEKELTDKLKLFYMGNDKIPKWRYNSGYLDAKNSLTEQASKVLEVGEMIELLADEGMKLSKRVSQAPSPALRLAILESLLNEDTQRKYKKNVEKYKKTITEITAPYSYLKSTITEYSPEAQAMAEERKVKLSSWDFLSKLQDKIISLFKNTKTKVLNKISQNNDNLDGMIGELSKCIGHL